MILKWKCKIYVNYYTFQFLEHLWTISLIAQQKYLLIYAEEMRLYCGLCLLPSTVNWARWTMNSIYCGPSLPYAGIHQDLGYRHLRPTKNTKIISTELHIGVFHFRFCSSQPSMVHWLRWNSKYYSIQRQFCWFNSKDNSVQ